MFVSSDILNVNVKKYILTERLRENVIFTQIPCFQNVEKKRLLLLNGVFKMFV